MYRRISSGKNLARFKLIVLLQFNTLFYQVSIASWWTQAHTMTSLSETSAHEWHWESSHRPFYLEGILMVSWWYLGGILMVSWWHLDGILMDKLVFLHISVKANFPFNIYLFYCSHTVILINLAIKFAKLLNFERFYRLNCKKTWM